ITHPTVLSLTDGFEPPPGRGRPYPLQLAAERLEMRPLLLDGRAGEKGTASFLLIGDGKEPDPPIEPSRSSRAEIEENVKKNR
ncbi:MAG: hypothetical protein IJI20_02975, partial [Firmicutes bacterium]|nr:hypothetical protein [Bacillota bacterium]